MHIALLSYCSYGYLAEILQMLSCFFTENKRKVEMIEQLKSRGYRSDPVKAWKAETSDELEEGGEDEGEEQETGSKGQPDYNYLLSMQLWSLTREKKEELLKSRDKKVSGDIQRCLFKCLVRGRHVTIFAFLRLRSCVF